MFKTYGITDDEEDAILTLVKRIYKNIKTRCHQNGCNDAETSASLYSIQDFLGTIDTDDDAEQKNLGQS